MGLIYLGGSDVSLLWIGEEGPMELLEIVHKIRMIKDGTSRLTKDELEELVLAMYEELVIRDRLIRASKEKK